MKTFVRLPVSLQQSKSPIKPYKSSQQGNRSSQGVGWGDCLVGLSDMIGLMWSCYDSDLEGTAGTLRGRRGPKKKLYLHM